MKKNRTSGTIVLHNQPCDIEGPKECHSSDAMQVYDDHSKYCFSCYQYGKPEVDTKTRASNMEEELLFNKSDTKVVHIDAKNSSKSKLALIPESQLTLRGFRERGITKSICEFYGVLSVQSPEGKILKHVYPTRENGVVTGQQVRTLPKDFKAHGSLAGMFGMDLFPAKGRRIIVTEGMLDCMAVAQATFEKYNKIYPVVSVAKGSGNAAQSVLENRKKLRGFDEVILMFDEDVHGREAAEACAKIIGYDKAKIAKMPKEDDDPCKVFTRDGGAALLSTAWDAEAYRPAGIISKDLIWEAMQNYQDKVHIPYPDCLGGLNDKFKGMRQGEIALFTSGTGCGKSTILREIIWHLLSSSKDAKVGIISLEESPAETGRNLGGLSISKNPAAEEISPKELKEGFDNIFGEDRVVLLDHDGCELGSDLVDIMEWMALCGCTHIFLDHITIAVSEGVDGMVGNEATDKFMNQLGKLVKRHDVWLGVVSHLRKMGEAGKSFEDGKMATLDDIRGSGSIKQVSYDIIAFARNLNAKTEKVRNTITLAALKGRTIGRTGFCGQAEYDWKTGRLSRVLKNNELKVEESGVDELVVEI